MPVYVIRPAIIFVVLAVMPGLCIASQEPDKWEPALRQFEEQDAKNPPVKGGILFVGSSTIRMWQVGQCFPGLPALNRGFGGSMVADVIKHFDRVVRPYAPKTIVFYSGDNDIAHGKAVEEVIADYQSFIKRVWEVFPETRIVMMPIKPSIARWEFYPKMKQVNEALKAAADTEPRMEYVDIATPILGPDGKPRAEFFLEDGLHFNDAGYKLCTDLVMPHLKPVDAGNAKAAEK